MGKKNEQEIFAKLRQDLKTPLVKVERGEAIKVVFSLQVAKEESEHFYKNFAMIKYKELPYIVNYNNSLPDYKVFEYNVQPQDYRITAVSEELKTVIVESVKEYHTLLGYNLNPYTSLILLCLKRGLDLVKTGLLEV